jgi:hypothetical protein
VIDSWKSFFAAVEQMRQRQKTYEQQKTPFYRDLARSSEKAVDECIKSKIEQWARECEQKQLKLFESEVTQ